MDKDLRKEILAFLDEKISPFGVVAVAAYRPFLGDTVEKEKIVDILVVTNAPKMTLQYKTRSIIGNKVRFLVVDMKSFKKDVNNDWMGGILVENLLLPYIPLINKKYLWKKEIEAKKRIITEILGNLILEYPETCRELLIEPKYFMLEAMVRKAALYPPIIYRFMNILQGELSKKNRIRSCEVSKKL